MINTLLIYYQTYSRKQRFWLCIALSILFVSATETKTMVQHIKALQSAQQRDQLATQALTNQTNILQQAQTLTAAIQKSQPLLHDEDLENTFTRAAKQAQIFDLAIHNDGANQYTLNASAPWQSLLKWIATIHSTSKPIALTLTRHTEENIWTMTGQIETHGTGAALTKHTSSALAPGEMEWLGLLQKNTHYWVFLKQADQTILGLTKNEYIPTTHWQIHTLTAKQMVLENSDSHEYFTRDFA